MVNVKGKWALITGASRGVGYQIATFMAKMGCNLILHGRKLEHLEKISEEVKKYGIETYCVQAEFSELTQVVTMLDEIESTGIAVDIVFNNAGLQVAYRKDFWKTPIEDFEISFRVNFISAVLICYRLIPPMIERGFGRVVNVTSGIKNEPEQAAYSVSKAALDKFTKDLSSKLDGTNVMINLADPGWCRTDLGGPNAPNPVESVIPGIVIGAFIDDKKSGRLFPAQSFTGLTLEEAVAKAEKMS